jgi:phosphatidate cytidylyltransferase
MRAPGFASNLARRAGTGLVALPVVVALLLEGPPWLAVTIIVLALALGLAEFFRLLAARGMRPLRAAGALLAAAFFLEVVAPGWLSVPFVPLGALLLLTLTLGRGGDRESVSAAAATLLGAIYLGALGGTIAALRLQPPVEAGGLRLVLLLAIQVFSDSIAYFVGHGVGRRRLLPSVSPGKSVEGALGGLLGGVLGAFAARELWLPDLPAWHTAALGLAVAAMGIVGDLDESLLKRWAGVKDSGRLFPGHGGMLDRLDSLLFGAPVLYYYFEFVR